MTDQIRVRARPGHETRIARHQPAHARSDLVELSGAERHARKIITTAAHPARSAGAPAARLTDRHPSRILRERSQGPSQWPRNRTSPSRSSPRCSSKARALAARRGTSISALLADELRRLVAEDRTYEGARQESPGADENGARSWAAAAWKTGTRSMTEVVFVDTNILVYAYDQTAGEKHIRRNPRAGAAVGRTGWARFRAGPPGVLRNGDAEAEGALAPMHGGRSRPTRRGFNTRRRRKPSCAPATSPNRRGCRSGMR